MAKIVVQAISWLGTIYVLRTLDGHALGLFAIASVAFSYAALIYEGGMLEALVQRRPTEESDKRSVFTLLLASGLLTAAILLGLSEPIALIVESAEVAPLVRVLAFALLGTALGILPQAELMREMKFGRLAIIASIQAVCASGTTVVLAWRGAGAWSLVIGMLAGIGVRTALLNVVRPSFYWPTTRMKAAFSYLRTSGQLIADGMLWRWYTSIDIFLLGRWAGTVQLGQYSFAQQVANMPLEKISTVINDVSLPAYSELSMQRHQAASLMLETIRTHAVIGLPIFWGLASVAVHAVPLIFGEQWRAAVFPLIAMAIVAPVRLMGSVETPAMTGIGRVDVLLRTKLLIVPCMTVALFVGCKLAGITGAALVWLCVFPLCYATAFRWVLAAMGLSYRDVFAAMRGPIAAAIGMSMLVVFVQQALSHVATFSPWVLVVLLIALGASTYTTLLRWFDRPGFDLMWQRGRRMLSSGR